MPSERVQEAVLCTAWGGDYIVTYSLLIIFSEGVNILWHCIFNPGNICSGWLYRDIFSLLTIFGEGVIISWHYIMIFIPDTTLEFGTGGDYIWIFSLSKFDSAGIRGLKWLYLSMIPSLLLKLKCFGGYVNGLHQQSLMNKICKKS